LAHYVVTLLGVYKAHFKARSNPLVIETHGEVLWLK